MKRWKCLTNLAQEQPMISVFTFPYIVFRSVVQGCFQNSVWEQVSRILWLASTTWRIQIRPGNSLGIVMRNIKPLEQQVINFVQRTGLRSVPQDQSYRRLQQTTEQARISHAGCLQQTSEQAWDQLRKVFAAVVLRSAMQGVHNSNLQISWVRCLQQQSQDQSSKVFASADQSSKVFVAAVSRSVLQGVCKTRWFLQGVRLIQQESWYSIDFIFCRFLLICQLEGLNLTFTLKWFFS